MSDHPDHEAVPPAKREKRLKRDNHRCQYCNAKGTAIGGFATLEIHHKTREPEDMDVHDLENLLTACRSCHSWHHLQTTDEEVPVDLSEADLSELLPHDLEIIKVLAEMGPASTGEIVEAITADISVMAVRERLYVLMGLDNVVEDREQQLIDQETDTGQWGLPDQIVHSERGRIPEDTQTLLQRTEDEQVRQALARGCDREMIAEVFGIVSRTTWHKEKRANAYDFPLEAVSRAGEAGDEAGSGSPPPPADAPQESDQQQLETVAAMDDSDHVTDATSSTTDGGTPEATAPSGGETAPVQEQLVTAIEALQAVKESLARA
ncbi:HNH endonuclease [Haloarcula laminariae]|uniref:HNH endonuclease n=1 Tax=Haloarcula laminariae TaxID=2961577 RepID=UPI0021C67E3F|nr:HNH endonuclease [Halomicroarcula laminariae]